MNRFELLRLKAFKRARLYDRYMGFNGMVTLAVFWNYPPSCKSTWRRESNVTNTFNQILINSLYGHN